MCAVWDPYERLSQVQHEKLWHFEELLQAFNRRVNLISRDTEQYIHERHILHSLSIAYRSFPPGSVVVDWGSGGGLPVVPLAICFPNVTFHAIEATGKKVHALTTFARRLSLDNLTAWHTRAETWERKADFSISRATASLPALWQWHQRSAKFLASASASTPAGRVWKPGLICLKGGDLDDEIAALHALALEVEIKRISLHPLLRRDYFRDKYLVSVY